MLFNFTNKHANGEYFQVETDGTIGYSLALNTGPFGFENGVIIGLRGLLEGIGRLPAPCFNDFFKCQPPPGKLSCCDHYALAKSIVTPSPDFDLIKAVNPGHVNKKGLTDLGKVAIKEMMRLGMMIDIDHMSQKSVNEALLIAEEYDYPLNSGHNGVRAAQGGTERSLPEGNTKESLLWVAWQEWVL